MLAEQCRRLGLDVDAPAPVGEAAGDARARGAGAGRSGGRPKPRDPAALDISSIHRRVRSLMLAKGERGGGGEPPAGGGDAGRPAGWEARAVAGGCPGSGRGDRCQLSHDCGLAELPSVRKMCHVTAAETKGEVARVCKSCDALIHTSRASGLPWHARQDS